MIRVLFVCMGNICRSPTAEEVFRQLVREAKFEKKIIIDSAGTHTHHLGKPPDPRAIEIAHRQGIDLSGLTARQIVASDFFHFDYILAMDMSNLRALRKLQPVASSIQPQLLLDYSQKYKNGEVPDPFHGTLEDYCLAMSLIRLGTAGLLEEIKEIGIY